MSASLHVQHVGSDRQVWFGNPLLLVSRLSGGAQEGEALSRVQDMTFALDQLLASPDGAVVDPGACQATCRLIHAANR